MTFAEQNQQTIEEWMEDLLMKIRNEEELE